MTDISSTISEVQLFLEKMRSEMPEVFDHKTAQPSLPFSKKAIYLGTLYETRVEIIPDAAPMVRLENGILTIQTTDAETFAPKTILESWYRSQAETIFAEKSKAWGEKMSVQFQKITIKDQKTLWGSCSSKGNLNFCWRLIKAPEPIVDYLVVHELAHLIHMNHSPEFWGLVMLWCPEYKNHRKWLNDHKDAILSELEIPKPENADQPQS